jgi:hypothetical protein
MIIPETFKSKTKKTRRPEALSGETLSSVYIANSLVLKDSSSFEIVKGLNSNYVDNFS